jgi:hypothetical protein
MERENAMEGCNGTVGFEQGTSKDGGFATMDKEQTFQVRDLFTHALNIIITICM